MIARLHDYMITSKHSSIHDYMITSKHSSIH